MCYLDDEPRSLDEDSFFMERKKSITIRLKELASKGKTREVAESWGVSTSTLDRYINKGSMPSLDRAIAIANSEGVTLEWLATGCDLESKGEVSKSVNQDFDDWNRMLNIMTKSDSDKLLEVLVSRGVNNLLLSQKTINIALLIKDLPEDSLKEISILINHAQYCALTGKPFRIVSKEIENASGRRA